MYWLVLYILLRTLWVMGMSERSNLKFFMLFYTIFTLIMLLISGVSESGSVIKFPNLVFDLSSISTVIGTIFSLVSVFIFLFTYSLNYSVLNIILWVFRVLAFMDFLLYIKRVGHPTTV